jgi:hypothetical protein
MKYSMGFKATLVLFKLIAGMKGIDSIDFTAVEEFI